MDKANCYELITPVFDEGRSRLSGTRRDSRRGVGEQSAEDDAVPAKVAGGREPHQLLPRLLAARGLPVLRHRTRAGPHLSLSFRQPCMWLRVAC